MLQKQPSEVFEIGLYNQKTPAIKKGYGQTQARLNMRCSVGAF
jgi:hypothetical protein